MPETSSASSNTIIDDVRRTIIPRLPAFIKTLTLTSSRSLRNRESKPRRDRDVVERVRDNLEDSSESYTPQHISIHPWACKLSNPSTPAGSQLNVSIWASSASAVGASAVLVQRRVAVEVLVTTPESLALQLSYEDAGSRFRALGSIVVDEWHESWVVSAECCWSWAWRGCGKSRPQRRYGSVGDDRQSGGSDAGAVRPVRQGHLIAVRAPRRILIETALPPHIERFAWAGHLGLSQLGRVVEVASAARTVLVFTNTRSQAELWHEALASVWPHPLRLSASTTALWIAAYVARLKTTCAVARCAAWRRLFQRRCGDPDRQYARDRPPAPTRWPVEPSARRNRAHLTQSKDNPSLVWTPRAFASIIGPPRAASVLPLPVGA